MSDLRGRNKNVIIGIVAKVMAVSEKRKVAAAIAPTPKPILTPHFCTQWKNTGGTFRCTVCGAPWERNDDPARIRSGIAQSSALAKAGFNSPEEVREALDSHALYES